MYSLTRGSRCLATISSLDVYIVLAFGIGSLFPDRRPLKAPHRDINTLSVGRLAYEPSTAAGARIIAPECRSSCAPQSLLLRGKWAA